jgi:hypothetical protein
VILFSIEENIVPMKARSTFQGEPSFPGVYILENTPPPRGKYQPMSFGGKNMKRPREKGGKCRRKRKKGVRKLEKGK